jgi:hypothetical protein
MPLSAGTKLGPYQVDSAIGAGGMGEVDRANDTRLDRAVAIEVVRIWRRENPARLRRADSRGRLSLHSASFADFLCDVCG